MAVPLDVRETYLSQSSVVFSIDTPIFSILSGVFLALVLKARSRREWRKDRPPALTRVLYLLYVIFNYQSNTTFTLHQWAG